MFQAGGVHTGLGLVLLTRLVSAHNLVGGLPVVRVRAARQS